MMFVVQHHQEPGASYNNHVINFPAGRNDGGCNDDGATLLQTYSERELLFCQINPIPTPFLTVPRLLKSFNSFYSEGILKVI